MVFKILLNIGSFFYVCPREPFHAPAWCMFSQGSRSHGFSLVTSPKTWDKDGSFFFLRVCVWVCVGSNGRRSFIFIGLEYILDDGKNSAAVAQACKVESASKRMAMTMLHWEWQWQCCIKKGCSGQNTNTNSQHRAQRETKHAPLRFVLYRTVSVLIF